MADEKIEDKLQALDLTTNKPAAETEKEDFVDPWNVVGSSDKGIDYDKLISKSKNSFTSFNQCLVIINLFREIWIFKH